MYDGGFTKSLVLINPGKRSKKFSVGGQVGGIYKKKGIYILTQLFQFQKANLQKYISAHQYNWKHV